MDRADPVHLAALREDADEQAVFVMRPSPRLTKSAALASVRDENTSSHSANESDRAFTNPAWVFSWFSSSSAGTVEDGGRPVADVDEGAGSHRFGVQPSQQAKQHGQWDDDGPERQ
jgi:hypothetical protein